ncbi:aminotransferase class I/II-fold pyridoxal phosphate-dependent enzyme [Paenibacillus sp. F411]|uniref:aminotransferase class I/II-fold pyridoxal phosphate-dependent enzyme n=1 Tax=Paenibacillus sp. F411 TaxID=2820239 RepID=UPI001AAF27A2|nr:aminotransferase class I/II-fold pyridoxal phosphate-dependent enzyme [Paenibacillus sp. F411]MBO2945920.1 aminotransferase class I/II-fold pyridoxal phosphate-dependent enzyme [Paenibacillus sp. F411]
MSIEYKDAQLRNKESAPLWEALQNYREKGRASFHVPGHKNGKAYMGVPGADLLMDVFSVDVTEITGTDDLHQPDGVILEAQRLAADCFGAEESFFLVGGSTAGNLAMILTVCAQPGDLILVQRNVHKSVLNGLMLAGAQAVFLDPEVDAGSGLAIAPSLAAGSAALSAYPKAKGVLLTMPNYYGMGTDLTAWSELCHAAGIPLLVDEAHGAHYGQHPDLPRHALSCGADVVVQSTHKMLAAMTMGAMLHVQGPRLDRALLRQRLAMVQSSSPSYPVMGSLDLARRLIHAQGPSAFTAGLAAVNTFKRGLAQLPRLGLLQPPQARPAAYTHQDPFKAVMYDRTGALSGFALQRALEERGCVPEMSDEHHVVLLFTLGSTEEDAKHLLQALQHMVEEDLGEQPADSNEEPDQISPADSSSPVQSPQELQRTDSNEEPDQLSSSAPSPLVQSPQELQRLDSNEEPDQLSSADSSPQLRHPATHNVSTWNIYEAQSFSEPVAFHLGTLDPKELTALPPEQCAGEIAGETIVPYPPGIPLLYTGERITPKQAKRLVRLRDLGAKCQGAADPALRTILVRNTSGKQVTS